MFERLHTCQRGSEKAQPQTARAQGYTHSSVHVYIHTYIYVYAFMYANMYVRTNTHIQTHVHTYTHIRMCTSHTCVNTYVYTHTCMYTHSCIHICIHIARAHTYTDACEYVSVHRPARECLKQRDLKPPAQRIIITLQRRTQFQHAFIKLHNSLIRAQLQPKSNSFVMLLPPNLPLSPAPFCGLIAWRGFDFLYRDFGDDE